MAALPDCDVLVAGLGPVGQLLGNLLGAAGVRTVLADPAPGPSGLPRAATTDDEALRVLQGLGLDTAVAAHLAPQPGVAFVAADGRRLSLLETAGRGPAGHPPLAAWHQPGVERVLSAGLARFASVDARWGAGVEALDGDADGVAAIVGGEPLRARWVVGCDGASSPVRRMAGIGFRGSTFAQPWLVVDAEVDAPVPGVDRVHFVGDPRRPAVTLPMAPGRHRWEFMSSAREDHAALASEASVEALLAPWTREVRVGRRAVYTFHARTADRWRAGRILLAGDAAHVMPPFAGQGLAAGVRDAANLAWKLAAVLRGAPEALLDTYEAERRPDVRAATRLAVAWGAVLQTRRRRLARARDAVLFAVDPTPAGAFLRGRARSRPPLRSGCVLHPRRRGAGALFPQPEVEVGDGAGGRRIRLDDALGDGWAVLGALEAGERAAWEAAGARVPAVEDVDGAIGAWLARHRAAWVALRPDRHVFALGRPGEAPRAAAAAAGWMGLASAG